MQHFTRARHGFARKLLRQEPAADRPPRRPAPAPRRAGRRRLAPTRTPRSPRPSAPHPRSIRPYRSRRGDVRRARAGAWFACDGTATVMPRPIAAGVLGMARTNAHGIRQCAGEELQRPPGHDRYDQTGGVDHRRNRRQYLTRDLWLHGDDDRCDLGQCCRIGIDPHAVVGQGRSTICGEGSGSITTALAGSRPALQTSRRGARCPSCRRRPGPAGPDRRCKSGLSPADDIVVAARPRPRSRTSPRPWPRGRICRPRPRTGTPENSVRRNRARSRAPLRTAGPRR